MGISASSLLDQSKSDYIKGQAEAELKEFSPYYRKQYSVTHFHQVEDDLEQHKETITQLLKQRDTPEEGEVLYEDAVLHFDETRKWRERYVVVRANYCLECHDSLESYMKGVSARHKLLPTGGAVLTREECYMSMVDKCFPDNTSNVKEDFAPPLAGMPGQFPVYLRLPYRRDYYFCFRQEAKQADFLSILSDCIRHQNQDFLKRKTCEVQAFLKAIQLYRQEKGKYEAWDMLIGSDVRVMANLIMEQLLPTLEKDMLPRLKAKKTEKKRVWFATVEAAYILVQEHLLDGLSALKKECGIAARQQEVLIHSDMDQIVSARTLVENKLRASVSEPAEKFCLESVQPYLASALEELMEPISSGFQEGRQLSDSMMERICQDFQVGGITEGLNQALAKMARPNLLSCYQKIGSLEEKLPHLHQRFGFSNVGSLIHSAQIDLQQLMQNAAFTFQQLLHKAIQDNPEIAGSAMEKARHRVLKQYDYDSSSVRKRIFQEALVAVTLPHIKKNLAPIVKPDLQGLEQLIYADHANLVHVENVYEGILLQTLDKEVTKVVKEAASLKKHNLFTDSRDLLSQSSRSSLSSPTPSSPGSPASLLASHMRPAAEPERATVPSSPCMDNSLASDPLQEKEDVALPVTAKADAGIDAEDVVVTPAENEERKAQVVDVVPVADTPVAPEDAAALQTAATADADPAAEAEEAGAAAEAVNERREVLVEEEKIETSAEALTQSRDAPVEKALQGTPTPAGGAGETHDQEECIMPPPLEFANDQTPVCHLAEGVAALTVIHTEEEDSECSPPEVELEAPSCGEGSALAAGECSPALDAEEAELVAGSESSSLNVYAGSDCAASDLESMESGEKASSTSDPMEEEGDVTEWTASSSDPSADTLETPPVTRDGPSTLTGAYCGDATSREDAATEACKSPETATSEAPAEVPPPPGPDAPATDCIREIRDLVVEVIEVEELVQHYPSDIPADQ